MFFSYNLIANHDGDLASSPTEMYFETLRYSVQFVRAVEAEIFNTLHSAYLFF